MKSNKRGYKRKKLFIIVAFSPRKEKRSFWIDIWLDYVQHTSQRKCEYGKTKGQS